MDGLSLNENKERVATEKQGGAVIAILGVFYVTCTGEVGRVVNLIRQGSGCKRVGPHSTPTEGVFDLDFMC